MGLAWTIWLLALLTSASARDLTLPDAALTPGAVREITIEQICTTKWGHDRRAVSASMKKTVLHSYGLKSSHDHSQGCTSKRGYEIDHKIPRCAGGADVPANLSPQCYSGEWNATMKDRLEVLSCKKICSEELTPEQARALFDNWKDSFVRYFGEP